MSEKPLLINPHRIDVRSDFELEYWSKRFGVTEALLIMACANAGPLVANFKSELLRLQKNPSQAVRLDRRVDGTDSASP